MPKKRPTLRPARPDDIDALQTLEKNFPTDRLSRRQMLYHMKSSRAVFLVAAASHDVAGYALFFRRQGRAARFYSLVTARKYRGAGYGRALIEDGVRRLRRAGERAVTLEVRARDAKTIAFYKRCGFVAGEIVPSYYADGRDALKMRKDLT